jgi:multiple sugar transport system ATP-binding protein
MDLVGDGQGLPVEVNLVEELGADAYVYGTADYNGEQHDIIARADGRRPPRKGDKVHFAPKPGHVHVFSTVSGERLRA